MRSLLLYHILLAISSNVETYVRHSFMADDIIMIGSSFHVAL